MQEKKGLSSILAKANTKITVGWAAALLASSTLVSSLLGLLRERLLLANFGIGAEVDAYKAAFTLPDFMFFLLVSGALSVTFIPVFTSRLTKGNKQSAWQLSSSLLNFMAILTGVASILIIIFANPILKYLVAPGLSASTQALAVHMMRIIALNPLLFAISSVFTSIQQAVGRFFFYALSPSVYNIGIIFGILVLAPQVGIIGVAYGVLIGSVLQLLASILGMIGLGFHYEPKIHWGNLGFKRVLQLLPARSLDQGIDYFNNLVEINLASRLRAGAITAYQTAFTLQMVPISLIGVAISTAVFPKLSERLSYNRTDLFGKDVAMILRIISWLVLPTAVIAFLGRGYLVRLLVANGNSTISALLGILVGAIVFRTIFHLLTRTFYAQQDTKTPLRISVVAIGLNILLAIYLSQPNRYGIYGLAIAQSFTALFEVSILFVVLSRRIKGIFTIELWRSLIRMLAAAVLTAVVTYGLVAYIFPLQALDVGFFALVPKFTGIVLISLLTYVWLSYVFAVEEAYPVINKIVRVLFKSLKLN